MNKDTESFYRFLHRKLEEHKRFLDEAFNDKGKPKP